MRAAVIANLDDADAGYVGARLVEHGAHLDVADRADPTRLADAVGTPDVLVVLGSDWSVHDRTRATEVAAEATVVRSLVEHGVPVFAICYGAQLSASAFGCTVGRGPRPEIGWYTLRTDAPALVGPGPWFQLHFDRWTPNTPIRSLAVTDDAPQAFQLERMLAVQFHPEVTPPTAKRWLRGSAASITAAGFDIDAIEHELDRTADEALRRAADLVDTFLEVIADTPLSANGGDTRR